MPIPGLTGVPYRAPSSLHLALPVRLKLAISRSGHAHTRRTISDYLDLALIHRSSRETLSARPTLGLLSGGKAPSRGTGVVQPDAQVAPGPYASWCAHPNVGELSCTDTPSLQCTQHIILAACCGRAGPPPTELLRLAHRHPPPRCSHCCGDYYMMFACEKCSSVMHTTSP